MPKQNELEFDMDDIIDWRDLKKVIDATDYSPIAKKNIFQFEKKGIIESIKKGVHTEKSFYYPDSNYIEYKFIKECVSNIQKEYGDELIDSDDITISIHSSEDHYYHYEDFEFRFSFCIKSTPKNAKKAIKEAIKGFNAKYSKDIYKLRTTYPLFDKKYIEENF